MPAAGPTPAWPAPPRPWPAPGPAIRFRRRARVRVRPRKRRLSAPRLLWGERPDKGSARPGRRAPRRPRSALRGQPRGGRPRCGGGRGGRRAERGGGPGLRWQVPPAGRWHRAGGAAAPGGGGRRCHAPGAPLRAGPAAERGPAAAGAWRGALRCSPGGVQSRFVPLLVQSLFGVVVRNFRTVVNLSLSPTRANPSSS